MKRKGNPASLLTPGASAEKSYQPALIGLFSLIVVAGLCVVAWLMLRESVQPGLALAKALESGRVRERRQAAREFASVKPAGVTRALTSLPIAVISDKDSLVRTESARSIGRLADGVLRQGGSRSGMDEAMSGLVLGLKDPDPNVREACTLSLAYFSRHVPSPPPELVDLLESDPEITVRTAAATAMVQYTKSTEREIQALFQAMDDDDLPLRVHCSDALSRVMPQLDSLDVLTKALQHPRNEVRFRAADLIGRLGRLAESAIPALILNLDAPEPRVKSAGDPASIGWDPAWAAAQALARVAKGSPSERMVIDALSKNLSLENIDRAVSAASALELFGDKACVTVPDLIKALDRSLAVSSMGERSATLANAVGRLGPCDPKRCDEAIAVLVKALSSRNEFTTARAAAALAKFGPKARPALPALMAIRKNESLLVGYEAARAIIVIREGSP